MWTKEKQKEYLRAYAKTPQRIAYVKEYEARIRKTEAYRKRQRDFKRRWRQTPAGKLNTRRMDQKRNSTELGRTMVKAKKALQSAVYSGKIQRLPCEKCGNPNTHAHHHDYSKPLEVRWLCALHHKKEHQNDY